ncbi:MAG: Sua5/YciO/YrdC/YwlC family protein [Bacteroidota bacterium]
MRTYHLHITGQVQGVGFRPFVYQTALAMGLKGWVNNGLDGVHVEFEAEAEIADQFVDRLLSHPPARARIAAYHLQEVEAGGYETFEIRESKDSGSANLLLSPDFAICETCRQELHDPTNHRYQYPFITCTQCGPRYSILTALPYDRERTSMASFEMCTSCAEEYADPFNRRHFSQTNSCPDCAIELSAFQQDQLTKVSSIPQLLRQIQIALAAGEILAVKGIGGFLLMCDATRSAPIQLLRARKHRPSKPLAVMYPDLEQLQADVELDPASQELLTGPIAPIVLLPVREVPMSGIQVEDLAPGLDQIGAVLPYAPLLELICQAWGKPLVATSGNLSGHPIAFTNEEGLALQAIADLILIHNREIQLPQDDSVFRALPEGQPPILLRRSRGLAPTLVLPGWTPPTQAILAMGAQMKSSFAINHGVNTYLSQYLGTLDEYDTQLHYELSLRYWLELLTFKPEQVFFLQRVEDPLDDSAESIDDIVEEVIRESVALERQERRAKGLPANRRYTFRHCLPADATHLKLTGVCGAIAPIDECEYLKQVEWTPDAIQEAINYANALGAKGNQLIGCWRWE